ncbi:MAG: coiled-coil domain-containing protein-domain-containing protein [Piptocephalis tieghemiana]|nr:MAG: coiled-coil domain-containing protein-domain-containing protein [Piptocephalis tieghemiana]
MPSDLTLSNNQPTKDLVGLVQEALEKEKVEGTGDPQVMRQLTSPEALALLARDPEGYFRFHGDILPQSLKSLLRASQEGIVHPFLSPDTYWPLGATILVARTSLDSHTFCTTDPRSSSTRPSPSSPVQSGLEKARIRNRRWVYLKTPEAQEYFSEEDMRRRHPRLYASMVGREIRERRFHGWVDRLQWEWLEMEANQAMGGGLVDESVQRPPDQEDQAIEVEFDTESEDEEKEEEKKEGEERKEKEMKEFKDQGVRSSSLEDLGSSSSPDILMEEEMDSDKVTESERYLQERRKDFIQTVHELFLDGQDPGIPYEEIDTNSRYDDHAQETQDIQDAYFDLESPTEEGLVCHDTGIQDF